LKGFEEMQKIVRLSKDAKKKLIFLGEITVKTS